MHAVSLLALAAMAAMAAMAAPVAAVAQVACPLASTSSPLMVDGPLQATWQALPANIVVGQPFALLVTLCPAEAQLLRVDATMPEHRHGMNYRASLRPLGQGRWHADGLLWHMGGRWELTLDVSARGTEYRLRQSVQLP